MQSHDEDILKRVRRIEIKTRGLSDEIFAGKYHTAFRGRGMSFAEVREYRAGDDVRDIDWNVTARSHRPHVKVYEEERELTMMLIVDVSPSRMFGSESITKKNLITEVAATLAFSASKNNDKCRWHIKYPDDYPLFFKPFQLFFDESLITTNPVDFSEIYFIACL